MAETTSDIKGDCSLGTLQLFEIIVGTARIIGSAVLNPPGRDASGRAEKRMTAAWLVAWAGFNKRKWIERQCRGSTHKGEMLVGQHGEETAVWMGWDLLEENGTTIMVDDEEVLAATSHGKK